MRKFVQFSLVAVVLHLPYNPVIAQPDLGETTVRVVPKKSKIGDAGNVRDFGYIEISGDIRRAAIPKLAAAIHEARRTTGLFTHDGEPVISLFLNSLGGEVLAATQLGQLVRSQGIEVWVDRGAECSSACVFILAAGVSRTAVPGARIGIHRPYFRPEEFASLSYAQSQERYSRLAEGVRQYLAGMGIAESLYDAMLKVESRKLVYITEEFGESTRLLGDDPAYQEWRRAKDQRVLGRRRLEMLERFTDCINAGKAESVCSQALSGW